MDGEVEKWIDVVMGSRKEGGNSPLALKPGVEPPGQGLAKESMLGSIARSTSLDQIFTHVHRMDMNRRDPMYVGRHAGKDLEKLISLAQAALGRVGMP